MKKRKGVIRLVLIAVLVVILGYTVPAAATDGSFEVTVIVNGFDGKTPLTNVDVEMFGKTKNTNNRGACTFKLKNLPDSVSYPFSVSDNSGMQYGFGTVTIDRSNETGIMAHPAGAAGQFGIQLYYNDFTSFFTIISMVDQAAVWSVDMLDFDEAYPDFPNDPEPPRDEPPFEEPPHEGEIVDPDMPHEEPPEAFFKEPGDERFEVYAWWERVDLMVASLLVGVLILIILVIVLLIKNSRQKKKDRISKETKKD